MQIRNPTIRNIWKSLEEFRSVMNESRCNLFYIRNNFLILSLPYYSSEISINLSQNSLYSLYFFFLQIIFYCEQVAPIQKKYDTNTISFLVKFKTSTVKYKEELQYSVVDKNVHINSLGDYFCIVTM